MWHHVKYSDAVEVCIDIRKGVTTFSETVFDRVRHLC